MHRIDGAGATIDNKFTEGNPAAGVPATTVTAEWLNAVQEEVSTAVEATGAALDKTKTNQLLTAISAVDSIAALRALPIPKQRVEKDVLGYHALGDGGGGQFYWDEASTATDNGGTIILPTGYTGTGRWLRNYSGAVNVRWFGAKGDGVTNDTAAIQAALNAAVNGETVVFPVGRYLVAGSMQADASSKNVVLKGDPGAEIRVNDYTGFTDTYIGWGDLTYYNVFKVQGGATTNDRNFDLIVEGLTFTSSVTTQRLQAVYAPDGFNRVRFVGNKLRGFGMFSTCGQQWFTANGANPQYYADSAISKFEAYDNDIYYDLNLDPSQNGVSFHVLHALDSHGTGNRIVSTYSATGGYILRFSGGAFDTVPTAGRGSNSVKWTGNYLEANSTSEYCQVSKTYAVDWSGNTAVCRNPGGHNMIDMFNCINATVQHNVVTGGGIAFFGHADLNSGSYPADLIGARSFIAVGNTIVNPTHTSVFNIGGDGNVDGNRAGQNFVIADNVVTLLPGFTPNAGGCFLYSFICNNISVHGNFVKGLPRFIHTYFDKGYDIHGNTLIDVPELVFVEGEDASTYPTHAYYDNILRGTSGTTTDLAAINGRYAHALGAVAGLDQHSQYSWPSSVLPLDSRTLRKTFYKRPADTTQTLRVAFPSDGNYHGTAVMLVKSALNIGIGGGTNAMATRIDYVTLGASGAGGTVSDVVQAYYKQIAAGGVTPGLTVSVTDAPGGATNQWDITFNVGGGNVYTNLVVDIDLLLVSND